MLADLKSWTFSLAGRKSAQIWLGFIAFVESSVFPIPADVLFVPMVLARLDRAWRYAFLASFFSVLGGIAGWLIGFYAYEIVARPILEFYGKLAEFENLQAAASIELIVLLLVTSGLSHLPPMKVVTILSGVLAVNLWLFILLAIVARSARFYLLAWILRRYGKLLLAFFLKKLSSVAAIIFILLIVGVIVYKILW